MHAQSFLTHRNEQTHSDPLPFFLIRFHSFLDRLFLNVSGVELMYIKHNYINSLPKVTKAVKSGMRHYNGNNKHGK